ncbi:hypothetical protein F4778DRAFT_478264 [Xylariomycetidae sp. FL2044]|nr:hypothetical protein F4778DRAFT_478264 [Xylariomycetidae sp. FL2044]
MGFATRKMAKSRKSSTRGVMDDDIDAITPCPLPQKTEDAAATPEPIEPSPDYRSTRSTSPSSLCSSLDNNSHLAGRRRESIRALEEGTDGDPERLWKRMLALQQIYGCYNSARMSAALSSGDTSLLLPSKACLDLLNDHTVLPNEVESVLEERHPRGMGMARFRKLSR